jgi:hypothetical protein
MTWRPSSDPRYCGFINLPFVLLPSIDRIVSVMTDRISAEPQLAAYSVDVEGRDGQRGDWLDDIIRCVDAIRTHDWSAAALLLTDAFEGQRTILEPDFDVVCRELVRGALGKRTDVRQTLLDRYNDRRVIEGYLDGRSIDPLISQFADPLFEPPPMASLATFGQLVAEAKPNGIELVKSVLEEEVARSSELPVEAHLVDAILSSWRGMRERTLSSLEAALAGGVADPGQRLARFVALERNALKMGVELDLRKLPGAVAQKALMDDKSAARELAGLVKRYTEYLGMTLDPLAQRMIDVQMRDAE